MMLLQKKKKKKKKKAFNLPDNDLYDEIF